MQWFLHKSLAVRVPPSFKFNIAVSFFETWLRWLHLRKWYRCYLRWFWKEVSHFYFFGTAQRFGVNSSKLSWIHLFRNLPVLFNRDLLDFQRIANASWKEPNEHGHLSSARRTFFVVRSHRRPKSRFVHRVCYRKALFLFSLLYYQFGDCISYLFCFWQKFPSKTKPRGEHENVHRLLCNNLGYFGTVCFNIFLTGSLWVVPR